MTFIAGDKNVPGFFITFRDRYSKQCVNWTLGTKRTEAADNPSFLGGKKGSLRYSFHHPDLDLERKIDFSSSN